LDYLKAAKDHQYGEIHVTSFEKITVLLAETLLVEPLDDVEHADDQSHEIDAQSGDYHDPREYFKNAYQGSEYHRHSYRHYKVTVHSRARLLEWIPQRKPQIYCQACV